jgi:hypothetical protein
MSPGEFAVELGVAVEDYIAYETGKREIPTSLLIALIDRGAIDPAWVLTAGVSAAQPTAPNLGHRLFGDSLRPHSAPA